MDQNTDLTAFWLAWKKTCAIRLCLDANSLKAKCADVPEVMADVDKVASDAADVVKTTNKYFANMVRFPRYVKPLKRFAPYGNVDDHAPEDELEKREEDDDRNADGGAPIHSDKREPAKVFKDEMRKDAPTLLGVDEDPDDNVDPMHDAFNGDRMPHVRARMVSEYCDLVSAWDHHDKDVTSAFELVELDLYREAAEKSPVEERRGDAEPLLNGKKIKDYLFEDLCAATGNMCQSLWGYLLKKDPSPRGISRLRIVANNSFRNPLIEGRPTKDGGPEGPELPSPEVPDGAEGVLVDEAATYLEEYLRQRWWSEYDVSDRVVVCCAFFEYTMSDPYVASLVPIKGSAFNVRKMKRVAEIFGMLKDKGCSFVTVQWLFRHKGQELLRKIALEESPVDETCVRLVRYCEKV